MTTTAVRHDAFTLEQRPDGLWYGTCNGCGWRTGGHAHALFVQSSAATHTGRRGSAKP